MTKRYSGTEIVGKLRQAMRLFEQGKSLDEVCREIKVSKQAYQRWCDIHDAIVANIELPSNSLQQENHQLHKQLTAQAKILAELQEKYSDVQTELQWYKETLGEKKISESPAEPTPAAPTSPDVQPKPTLNEDQEQALERWETLLHDVSTGAQLPSSESWFTRLRQSLGQCLASRTLPIGIDLEDDNLTLVQLFRDGEELSLIHAHKATGPQGMETDHHHWDQWACGTLQDILKTGRFNGRKVALALPVRDTFIDHLTIPQNTTDPSKAIFTQMQKKLPFKATLENTIIRYLPNEGRKVVAFALERERVERYLALCEHTHLHPDTFAVWPVAMANSYAKLWAQNPEEFVMLVDIAKNYTNVVICRDRVLYYARTIPIGTHDLESNEMIELLSVQLDACRKHMVTLYGNRNIQRAIFFAGSVADPDIIRKIARKAQIAAQLGDPFETLTIPSNSTESVKVERCHTSWSVAFGLGLSGQERSFVRI